MKIINQFDDTHLDPARYGFMIQCDAATLHEDTKVMDEWLKANIVSRYRRGPRQMAACFIVDIFDPQEAMLFKMVWA